MSGLIIRAAFFGLPMITVMLLYRLFDRHGSRTAKLSDILPFTVSHKTAFQIGTPAAIIILFGVISLLCGISIYVYLMVCGVLIGLINGMAAALMHKD
ncbi:MAG: hypothetical protein J6M17_13975 [Ruminococcus sp.]|nr:hypothetical protein [Ruminococcus sp.]